MKMWPFGQKIELAAPERPVAEAPKQPEVIYLSSGVGVAIIQWNAAIAAELAMQHPIVYRALNKIAESVGQVRWFVEVNPGASAVEMRNIATAKKELQALLDSPNGEMTPEMLRYWMALNYASYGRVAMKFGFSATAKERVNGIYPLETRQVQAVPNNRGGIDRFKYGLTDASEIYPSKAAAKNSSAFIGQIWKPGLKGYQADRQSNTPLNAIGLPAQVITSLLRRAIQTAEGHPNVRYMVTCSKTLTENQKHALKAYIEDHAPTGTESGKIPILQNAADVEIHKLDNDLSDIHSKMPSDDMARLIFGAFGIPIALAGMGAADGAKFAGNYVESRQAFWQDTIIPGYVSPLFKGLSDFICPPGLRISADYDSIPALLSGRIDAMAKMKDIDFLSTDEKRELMGFEPAAAAPASEGDENDENEEAAAA